MGREGLNKKEKPEFEKDPEFERAKDNQERENKNKIYEGLASKFSELIAENPIVIYTQHGDGSPRKDIGPFNKVKDVRTDESGTGGGASINFDGSEWVSVGKNGVSCSHYFDKKTEYYKITKESLSNIMRMMDELIGRSGYSDQEKAMMSKYVFDNFRNKIIKPEDLEKVEK